MAAKTKKQMIVEDLANGMSEEECAKKHNVALSTVQRHHKTLIDVLWWRIRRQYEFVTENIPTIDAVDFWCKNPQSGNIKHCLSVSEIYTVGDLKKAADIGEPLYGIGETRKALLLEVLDKIKRHDEKYTVSEDRKSGHMPIL